MKKILFACLLCAVLPASAQGWVRYAETDAATMYFDSLHTRKMGDTAFVWDLHDLNAPAQGSDKQPFRSALFALEYNCRAKKSRILSAKRMTENMGHGAVASEENLVGEWMDADAASLAGKLFNHICE